MKPGVVEGLSYLLADVAEIHYRIPVMLLSSESLIKVSKRHTLLSAYMKFCLHFLCFTSVWINFCTGDAHKNLSACEFHANWCSEGILYTGMQMNFYPYFSHSLHNVGEIWCTAGCTCLVGVN